MIADITQVVVPVDLAEPRADALRAALELSGTPTEVHVVYALPEVEPNLLASIDDAHRITHARASLKQWLDDEGFPDGVRGHVAVGEPSRVVVDVCHAESAHLVVVHSAGRTGMARALLGSTAERIARRAPCPVLLLKDPPA